MMGNQIFLLGMRLLEGARGGGVQKTVSHLVAISIVRIRCESVMVNKTLASSTGHVFTRGG